MLQAYHNIANIFEAGIDEAGRGCYAGPVFAAAVILPKNFEHPLLNDSKQLSEKHRYALRPIIEAAAIAYSVAQVNAATIDQINILKASFKAMHLAIDALRQMPTHLLVDGNKFITYNNIPHTCVVKGDSIYASIAAASILAKTYRDDYMIALAKQYPQYGFEKHKGYGTLQHRKAIEQYGLCPEHRKSFNILPQQLSLM
ncbi:MAG: ribonuclease HII [Chitinophagaceae bacterium]